MLTIITTYSFLSTDIPFWFWHINLKGFDRSYHIGGFKSGLQSPAIPDEAVIKRTSQLSVSETINLHLFQTCEWENLILLVSQSFNLAVAEPLTNSLTYISM